jgi:hypothetical protein
MKPSPPAVHSFYTIARTLTEPPLNSASEEKRYRAADRRRQTVRALVYGSLRPRRLGPRRANDASIAAVDWHDARWLAVSLTILLFSCADAMLTLMLVERGAYEANPFMAPLVEGSALSFAIVKVALTGTGVIVLTMLARLRAFGRFRIGAMLYATLIGYAALLLYVFWLLERLTFAG